MLLEKHARCNQEYLLYTHSSLELQRCSVSHSSGEFSRSPASFFPSTFYVFRPHFEATCDTQNANRNRDKSDGAPTHGAGALVQDRELRLMVKEPAQRQSLLLPTRQHVAPVSYSIPSPLSWEKVIQLHRLQDGQESTIGDAFLGSLGGAEPG